MNALSIYLKTFWRLLTDPTPEQREVVGDARPFLIVMTVLLGIVSVVIVRDAPALFTPGRLLLFTLLMVIHLSLHWLSVYMTASTRLGTLYFVIQGALALCVAILAQAPALSLALFCALIGETLGMLGTTRLSWSAVIVALALMPLSYWLIGGQRMLDEWLPTTLPISIILIVFMVLFRKQLAASQRAQAFAADLEIANQQLAEYAAQVKDLTLAAERQRMARELHDTLAQGVAGIVLQLEAVKAHLGAKRHERAAAIIDQTLIRARSTLADSRAAIDDLRALPASLPEALRALAGRFTQATGIPCQVEIMLGVQNFVSSEIREHIERITSETLANVTRHAQARRVWMRLTLQNELLELEIFDNGRGFDPEKVPESGHYGLLGMRERARLTGGTLGIETGVGRGTRIRLVIPANQAGPATPPSPIQGETP